MRCFLFGFFLCSLVAGTTFQTPRGLTVQPSVQDLRLLPHGLNPRDVQEEALSGGLRSLLATTTTSDCAWSSSDKECGISGVALVYFLKKSGSGLAKYILGEFVCFAQGMKATCNKLEQCEWDDEEKRCSHGDMSHGFDDSPCVKAAPVLFRVVHFSTICSKIEDKESCSTTEHCEWSDDDKECSIDFFEVVFHLESYQQKTGEVFSAMVQEKSSAMMEDPQFSSSKFTWASILKWKPPKGTCPRGQQKTICEVVEAYLSVYLPVMIYCQGKYTTQHACKSDELCMVSEYGSCAPSEEIAQKAGKALAEVLIGKLSQKADKLYITSLFFCSDNHSSRKCHAGGCTWNLETKKCHLNSGAVFREVVKASGSTEDGLCAFLDVVSSDKCDEVYIKKRCREKEECEWGDSYGCSVDDDVIMRGALKGSSKALTGYREIEKKCTAKSSKADCIGVSFKADAITYIQ